jgi:hypothetical protein
MPVKLRETRTARRAKSLLRRSLQTLQAAWRRRRLDFSDLPIVFGNAMPKAGSHLLLQILEGLREAGQFASVEPEPIRTISQAERRWRSQDEILADLRRLRPGRIGWGYINATPENLAVLAESKRVNYFIYRDPRDLLVSAVYYARDKHTGHALHEYFNRLGDFDACLKVEIAGIDDDGLHLPPVLTRYERYLGFFDTSAIMPVRFEDLVTRRGETLRAMLDYYQQHGFRLPVALDQAVAIISRAIQPGRSSTFRRGQPGSWREHFSEENKSLFKDVSGDLLLRLGYEGSNDW